MGQADCLKVLEENGGWMSSKQIGEALGQKGGVVNRSLRRLYYFGEIEKQLNKLEEDHKPTRWIDYWRINALHQG